MARWQGPSWAVVPQMEEDTALYLDVAKEGKIVETHRVDDKSVVIMGRNQLVSMRISGLRG